MRRLLVSQVLSNTNIDASRVLRTREVRKTVKDVYGRIGTKIDINKVAFDTEMKVVTSMLWGRRICPGALLGEKMLMYIVASFFHSFEWRLPEEEDFDLSEEFGIVIRKKKALFAIPSPRLSDASLYI
ncbi:cytochrome P450 [Cynara cardunculus var. scolymus]|uniref:Cytochrome P450 n=1 Tax=Cynara cardunculus var. scolymus TaxID=59895 RepID=A0A103XJL8_CYNCS|nr:cytochrome P450 [Cynara cardunculus var. scolymus]